MGSPGNLKCQVGQMLTLEVHLLEAQPPLLILFDELSIKDDVEVQCGSFLPPSDLWPYQNLEVVDKLAMLVPSLPPVALQCLFTLSFNKMFKKLHVIPPPHLSVTLSQPVTVLSTRNSSA